MRLLALTCEVLARPVYLCAARSPHAVDVRLERRGLHDQPRAMGERLQDEIDSAADRYDAVVLAYGLCGGGTAGLRAGARPLVVPRAHDCITLLLGDRARYDAEMAAQPGTYWYTTDFVERSDTDGPFAGLGAVSDAEARTLHAAYVERYGRDNADYLMEALGAWQQHYTRAAFIETGAGGEPGAATAEAAARRDAERHGWAFERLAGRLVLIRRLLEGDWDAADFLVLEPGQRLAMSHDDGVVRAEPADPAEPA